MNGLRAWGGLAWVDRLMRGVALGELAFGACFGLARSRPSACAARLHGSGPSGCPVLLAQVGIDRKLAPCRGSDIGRSFSDLSCAARRCQVAWPRRRSAAFGWLGGARGGFCSGVGAWGSVGRAFCLAGRGLRGVREAFCVACGAFCLARGAFCSACRVLGSDVWAWSSVSRAFWLAYRAFCLACEVWLGHATLVCLTFIETAKSAT